jgi:hypothetical protein
VYFSILSTRGMVTSFVFRRTAPAAERQREGACRRGFDI